MERLKADFGLTKVAYAGVMMDRPSGKGIKSTRNLVNTLVLTRAKPPPGLSCANNASEISHAAMTDTLTLGAVARHLSGWKKGGGRTALVLHIDEFQLNPKAVLEIQ